MELIVVVLIFLFILKVVKYIRDVWNKEFDRTTKEENYFEAVSNNKNEENRDFFIKKEEYLPYKIRDSLMTDHEKLLFDLLKAVLGHKYDIYPQVNLDKIFKVEYQKQYRYYLGWLRKINQKSVDFLVVNKGTQMPILAIELDDASHEREERISRDKFVGEMFRRNNFPLVRFNPGCYKSEEIKIVFSKYLY